MAYQSIRPGQIWLDTNGNRIHAHGGSIIQVDGIYYWYGENKEKTVPGGDIWHWGVRCYASTDLYNWEDKGIIIPPEPEDEDSPLNPKACMDRPHILYNRRTKKYVCWLKIMSQMQTQSETVLIADNILGPYTKVQVGLKPLGMNAGDFDLVVAEDGKAYYYFERVHSELICADLTDDYTDVSGYYSTHFPYKTPPFVREAPAYFNRNNNHYLITSGTTGYHPNPSMAAMAGTFHGPWQVLGDPHVGDTSRTSFNSQISSVFKVPGKKDLYIALADRWIPNLTEVALADVESGAAYQAIEDISVKGFAPDAVPDPEMFRMMLPFIQANTSVADYVWLPIHFDGDTPRIQWLDEWRIEDFE